MTKGNAKEMVRPTINVEDLYLFIHGKSILSATAGSLTAENAAKMFEQYKKSLQTYISPIVKNPQDVTPLDSIEPETRSQIILLQKLLIQMGGGKVVVAGDSGTGKSFLIRQAAGNMKKIPGMDKLEFFRIEEKALFELENTRLAALIRLFTETSSFEPVLVADSAVFALWAKANLPASTKIILEVDTESFEESEKNSVIAKVFEDYYVVDMNSIDYTPIEIVRIALDHLLPKLRAHYPETKISDREISALLNLLFKELEYTITSSVEFRISDIETLLNDYVTEKLLNHDEYLRPPYVFDTLKLRKTIVNRFLDALQEIDDLEEEVKSAIREVFGEDVEFMEVARKKQDSPEKEAEKVRDNKPTWRNLTTLGSRLKKNVLGQDHIINSIVENISVAAAGLNSDTKPIRSMIFLGPTGVGKTQLTLELAKELTKPAMNVIRLDMSEYASQHESSKLFGAPPGYIGYKEGGILTSQVKEQPNSIILLDEVEKAHPKVWDSFLQIFDAGVMTDPSGEKIDFTKTIIVMTSNLGSEFLNKTRSGFVTTADSEEAWKNRTKEFSGEAKKALTKFFRPEFLNRIDDVYVFNELPDKVVENIVRREVGIVSKRLEVAQKCRIAPISRLVIEKLVAESDTKKYGARELQRTIDKFITKPVARMVIDSKGACENKVVAVTKPQGTSVLNFAFKNPPTTTPKNPERVKSHE